MASTRSQSAQCRGAAHAPRCVAPHLDPPEEDDWYAGRHCVVPSPDARLSPVTAPATNRIAPRAGHRVIVPAWRALQAPRLWPQHSALHGRNTTFRVCCSHSADKL